MVEFSTSLPLESSLEAHECPSTYILMPPYSPFTEARVVVAPELYGPGYL